ncbi:CDP-diacylglycerol--serine O-phosphatidyltransferase [Jeotgalibacillus proteolyticus]|uniref:CDP-diacylglycerol--serine O-phosphatidyltransferase n=1 Tax=Jeotgalibacillus proteolyticus TaxID=2082395 RepID=A0A2S5GER1_9BACL|nr:CDP-diacylglycerol--serine O-phosphatidyltransferase [Jeotgalibacillus proteolyticus]PPA71486.1 CDP-diacylglycerol--serine O-phosphatidyltransferase [Jeotgalibacillus proteolyticus]
MSFLQVIDITFKKVKAQTANILTLSNLVLGGFAALYSTSGHFSLAALLIFIAAFMDRFDGMAARKLGIESELGKQLDSMSDLVSFGVAPALLLYHSFLFEFGASGMILTIFYIGCGAYRLARFNTKQPSCYFEGLPITAAGCLAALSYLAMPILSIASHITIMFVLSLLMVSPLKVKKM